MLLHEPILKKWLNNDKDKKLGALACSFRPALVVGLLTGFAQMGLESISSNKPYVF